MRVKSVGRRVLESRYIGGLLRAAERPVVAVASLAGIGGAVKCIVIIGDVRFNRLQ